MTYNAILCLTQPDAAAIAAYREEHGQMPEGLRGEWTTGTWRNPEGYVTYDVQGASLADLDALLDAYPSTLVIGAWERDTGAAVREIHADALEIMPDVVERDEEGEEISRSRPDELRDHHRWAGQAAREWT